MPSGRDIRAGSAYVELTVKDKLLAGVKSAFSRLGSFAGGGAKLTLGLGRITAGALAGAAGAAIELSKLLFGVGAAAFSAASVAVLSFAKMGEELKNASLRTGVAVDQLSAYQHAAEQSGSSLEGFEGGLKKMQKTIGEAETGAKEAAEALGRIGLSVEDLKGLSPDKQFDKIAGAIDKITDPTERAAATLKIFGKSGTELLPMIQNLAALKKEAADAGLIVSDADATEAKAFGDSLKTVWEQAKMVVFYIGGGLVDALMGYRGSMIGAMATAIGWVKNSRQTIANVVEAFANGITWLIERFKDLREYLNQSFDGAVDALEKGDWKGASERAVAGVKIAWEGLKDWFDRLFDGIGDSFVKAMIRSIAKGKELWVRALDKRKKVINEIGDSLVVNHLQNEIDLLKKRRLSGQGGPADDKLQADLEKRLEIAKQIAAQGQTEGDDEAQAEIDRIHKQRDADLAAVDQQRKVISTGKDQALGERVQNILKPIDSSTAVAAFDGPASPTDLNQFTQDEARMIAAHQPPGLPRVDEIFDAAMSALKTTSGTFNPFAAQAMGSDDLHNIARNTSDTAKTLKDIKNSGGGFNYGP